MNLSIILIIIFILSIFVNYISLNKKITALDIAKDMALGYNLGNTFDSYNNIKEIKNPDVKTIIIPMTWMIFMDLGIINSRWMSRVKEIVD